jgi:excisionase family DNA binding protein
MTDHDLLTVEDVMDYLRVTRRTVYRWIEAGEIPAIHAGRQWRFRRQDFEAWLERRPEALAKARRTRILIVDDDPDARAFLTSSLLNDSHEVEAVGDGATALARLDQGLWDLLITDLKMKEMDGLGLVRRVRRRSQSLPIVVVTGHSTESSAIEAVNLGVSGYLTKPFDQAHVRAAVTRALNRARQSRSVRESAEAG